MRILGLRYVYHMNV